MDSFLSFRYPDHLLLATDQSFSLQIDMSLRLDAQLSPSFYMITAVGSAPTFPLDSLISSNRGVTLISMAAEEPKSTHRWRRQCGSG